MQDRTSAQREISVNQNVRARSTGRVLVFVIPLLVACLIVVLFNSILPRLTNYYYWVKPNSTMGWAVQTPDVVLHQIVPGKKNVVVIGDSRVSEGFSAVQANKISERSDINFIQAGVPGTTPRVWYYLLGKIDPDHKLFAAVVLMAPRFDDDNDANDLTNNAIDLTYLTPLTDFRDIPEIVGSFTGIREKIHALGTLISPLVTAREDLFDFVSDPALRIRDAKAYHEHFAEWLLDYKAPAISLPSLQPSQLKSFAVDVLKRPPIIADEIRSYMDSVITNRPGLSPAHSTAYRNEWYGKIAHEYAASKTPVLIFQVPRGPYESFAHRPISVDSALKSLDREKRITLLDPSPFEHMEQPDMFQDALHVNRSGQIAMTSALTRLVVQQIPGGK